MLAESGASDLVAEAGLLHVFRSRAALEGSRWLYDLRRDLGIRAVPLTGAEVAEREPCLAPGLAGGVLLPDVGVVSDPLLLARRMARRFEARGGAVLRETGTRVVVEGGRALGVDTARSGLVPGDVVVVAAGAWSAGFARALGVPVPLASERGYHAMVDAPAAPVRTALLLAERRVTVTPMRGGLRLGTMGTMAEFAHPEAAPAHGRAEAAFAGSTAYLPGLAERRRVLSRWVGPRPSTPDGRPLIGRAPAAPNAFLAFGHGHLGMTLAATTGALVADLAAGREPASNLAPFAPTRFRSRAAP